MKLKLTTRQLVTLAVFGALWGVVEISLGSVLKALNIPFSGAVLSAIGLMIAMIARQFVPRRGTTLFVGIIAMVLKLFSIGNIVIGPMVGILMEAVLAEIILSLFRSPGMLACLLAGMAGSLWSLVQPFVTGVLLFGRDLFSIWLDTLDLGERIFGIDTSAAWLIVLVLVVVYAAIGLVSGWLARSVGKLLMARLPYFKNQNP
jgi:ABC-type thiamin/hydroxymethylpyrimidine transport system permease subunit